MYREFTATAYIIENSKILLILHKKFGRWLPPGGHLLPGELPHEAAIREAKEETGLEIRLARENDPKLTAKDLPRPDFQFLYKIPPYMETPAHEHIDFCYIGSVIGGSLEQNHEETHGIRWFSLEELQEEPLLDSETRIVSSRLLQGSFFSCLI